MADMPAGTVSPEIAKLSEKLQKEPGSKIFFNLAEEYFRGGMLDEALVVLQTGLKVHPSYLGAKVLLGKVLAGQNKIKEAKELFEQILKVNPDNLIVNKKLGSIYFDERLFNEAEKCCNQVLFFSSKDADAVSLLQKIRESRENEGKVSQDLPVIQPPPLPPEEGPVQTEELPVQAEEPVNRVESGQPEQPVELPAEAVLSDANPPEVQIPLIETEESKELPEIKEESQFDFADIMKEEEVKAPSTKSDLPDKGAASKSKENLETMALAELYIKQGHYGKGIDIYEKLLDQDPYNETVRQQLEDARTIGNLLGFKSEPEQVEKNILEAIIPPQEEIPVDSQPAPETVNPKNQSKIARLRQWLELLKNVH